MFASGKIIYFDPFYFKNGNTAKPKYLIILKLVNNQTIVASLPTRGNHAPQLINKIHGCINVDDRCFNCYAIEKGRIICTNGFAFQLPTFIYGNEIEDYELSIFEEIYLKDERCCKEVGLLLDTEFNALIECVLNSSTTKRKIKKLLQQ